MSGRYHESDPRSIQGSDSASDVRKGRGWPVLHASDPMCSLHRHIQGISLEGSRLTNGKGQDRRWSFRRLRFKTP